MTSQQTRLRTEYRLQTTKAVQWSIRADTGVVTGDTQWNCAPMHTRTCSCQGNKLLAVQVRSSCSCFCQPTVYKIWHGDKQLPSNLLSSLIIGKLYFHHTVCSDALYSNSSTSEQIITNLAMRIMPLQTDTCVSFINFLPPLLYTLQHNDKGMSDPEIWKWKVVQRQVLWNSLPIFSCRFEGNN